MDYGFFRAFEQLCKDVAEIKVAVVALSRQTDDRAAAKALGVDVDGQAAGLAAAIPAGAGTPAQ